MRCPQKSLLYLSNLTFVSTLTANYHYCHKGGINDYLAHGWTNVGIRWRGRGEGEEVDFAQVTLAIFGENALS